MTPFRVTNAAHVDANIETALLYQAVFGPERTLEAAYKSWRASIDLSQDIPQASFELLPHLYKRLYACGLIDDFSPRLKGAYKRAWAEAKLRENELQEITTRFEHANVPLLLDGRQRISVTCYEDSALCPARSYNFATKAEHISQAVDIFCDLGWRPPYWPRRLDLEQTDEIVLKSSDWREIALRWRILPEAVNSKLESSLWERCYNLKTCETSILVQPIEDAVFCALIRGNAWSVHPETWIADILRLTTAHSGSIDLTAVANRAKAYRVTSHIQHTLRSVVPLSPIKALVDLNVMLEKHKPSQLEKFELKMDTAKQGFFSNRLVKAGRYIARRARKRNVDLLRSAPFSAALYLSDRIRTSPLFSARRGQRIEVGVYERFYDLPAHQPFEFAPKGKLS